MAQKMPVLSCHPTSSVKAQKETRSSKVTFPERRFDDYDDDDNDETNVEI